MSTRDEASMHEDVHTTGHVLAEQPRARALVNNPILTVADMPVALA